MPPRPDGESRTSSQATTGRRQHSEERCRVRTSSGTLRRYDEESNRPLASRAGRARPGGLGAVSEVRVAPCSWRHPIAQRAHAPNYERSRLRRPDSVQTWRVVRGRTTPLDQPTVARRWQRCRQSASSWQGQLGVPSARRTTRPVVSNSTRAQRGTRMHDPNRRIGMPS